MAISTRNPEPLPRHLERYAQEVDEWHRDALDVQTARAAGGQPDLRFSTT
jgi:hypothetical protein